MSAPPPTLVVTQTSATDALLASRERRPYEWHSEPPE
mgnify:FL=1